MDWGVEVLRFPPEKDLTDLELGEPGESYDADSTKIVLT
jgi:hypothetical protein